MYLLVVDFTLNVYAKQIKLNGSDEKLDIYMNLVKNIILIQIQHIIVIQNPKLK
jgi:hypothetical protein